MPAPRPTHAGPGRRPSRIPREPSSFSPIAARRSGADRREAPDSRANGGSCSGSSHVLSLLRTGFGLVSLLLAPPAVLAQGKSPVAGRELDPVVRFRGLGDLAGGGTWSEALAISDDGRVVVGRSQSGSSAEEGFVWTAERGLVPLPALLPSDPSSEPRALTPDGSVVVGKAASSRGVFEAVRWGPERGC